jgi:hypothetical protein
MTRVKTGMKSLHSNAKLGSLMYSREVFYNFYNVVHCSLLFLAIVIDLKVELS